MMRLMIAAVVALMLAATPSSASDCEEYKYGSPEWWHCMSNRTGPT